MLEVNLKCYCRSYLLSAIGLISDVIKSDIMVDILNIKKFDFLIVPIADKYAPLYCCLDQC